MPFGRDTRLTSDIVLDRVPDAPTGRGDLGSESPILSDVAYFKLLMTLLNINTWQGTVAKRLNCAGIFGDTLLHIYC